MNNRMLHNVSSSFWGRIWGGALAVVLAGPGPVTAQVALLTVGPDESFDTIQGAVNACSSGVMSSIHVQGWHTYNENIVIPSSLTAGSISISGGWNSSFTARDQSPDGTVIDGGGAACVLNIQTGGADVTVEGFSITNGAALSGSGVIVAPFGENAATVRLENLRVTGNHGSGTNSSMGGGVWAQLDGSERLEIYRCMIQNNSVTVTSGTGAAAGAGALITAAGNASFLVEKSWIEDNTATSNTGRKDGVGYFFGAIENAVGEVIEVNASGNGASGSVAQVNGSGGFLHASDNGQISARRCAWAFNTDSTGADSAQLRLWAQGGSSLVVSDSAMALGDHTGLSGSALDTAIVRLVNLTAVDNASTGIQLSESGSSAISLYNSIAYGNGTETSLGAGVETGSNLFGVDPLFVAPGDPYYNYRLDAGSPALDNGDNTPPGGLGSLDLDGRPRIENSTVDRGCYEGAGLLFADGFEGGGTGEWSSQLP